MAVAISGYLAMDVGRVLEALGMKEDDDGP